MALNLFRSGYTITEVVSQSSAGSRRRAKSLAAKVNATASDGSRVRLDADLVWFCVPDRQIALAARKLARIVNWKGKVAFHSSGALVHGELDAVRDRAAAVASVHPFMTLVAAAVPSLEQVPFAIEGDAKAVQMAREIVRRLGGVPFRIEPEDKVAYHAWGAFASPLVIALLVTAEQVARVAGVRPSEGRTKMLPIIQQTISNYATLGAAGAFSGPLVRGDAQIVRKHLEALRRVPQAREVYMSLARAALRYLPVKQREALKRSLGK